MKRNFIMKNIILDICINDGCNSPRQSSGSKANGDKLRPYCWRCHLALSPNSDVTYKEGVIQEKKDYCENRDGRLGFTCTATDLMLAQLDMDHIIPEAQGGHNLPYNMQTICKNCHARKSIENGDGRVQSSKEEKVYIKYNEENGAIIQELKK